MVIRMKSAPDFQNIKMVKKRQISMILALIFQRSMKLTQKVLYNVFLFDHVRLHIYLLVLAMIHYHSPTSARNFNFSKCVIIRRA